MDIITKTIVIRGADNPTTAIIQTLYTDGYVPTQAEKWNLIRSVRDDLVENTDWTQLPDAVLTTQEKEAWQNYRQTLRDIPQDFAEPELVIFPTPPE